jgi:hypothetical protein
MLKDRRILALETRQSILALRSPRSPFISSSVRAGFDRAARLAHAAPCLVLTLAHDPSKSLS